MVCSTLRWRVPGQVRGTGLNCCRHIQVEDLEIVALRGKSQRDGKEEDLCESLPDAGQETPLAQCLRSEMKHILSKAISELPDKERQVLSLYYYEELTMKEIGAVLGVGESRVSQIHSMAVLHLRERVSELDAKCPQPELTKGAASGV